MKLNPDSLNRSLSKQLSHIYLVGGEDPLLVVEAVDAIRAAAKSAGYTEREVLHAEVGFDWSSLRSAGQAMSLFGDKKLIELHLPGSPGREGGAALKDAAASPAQDVLILVRCGELDSRQRKSAWYQAIESEGAAVYGWAPKGPDLPRWVAARMEKAGVKASRDAIAMLAERVEGNLLAAAQDIDKLALLYPGKTVGADDIADAVADHARFAVFDLIDRALAGQTAAALRTLARLQDEGVSAVPLAWHLTHSARVIADSKTNGSAAAFKRHRVFGKRQGLFESAISRHSKGSAQWLVLAAGRADRVAKGAQAGNEWDELVTLTTVMSAGGQQRGWMRASGVTASAA